MPFPPPRNHRIPLADAKAMTRRYRQGVAKDAVRAFCFPRDCYDRILAQPGCAGIRSYLGTHEDGSVNLILVGVDADMNDMIHTRTAMMADGTTGGEGEGEIMQESFPCPVFCGDGNGLNAD